MVTKNIAKQPKAQVEVQISIPWVDLQAKWSELAQRLAQEIEIPGFRKGQAPSEMVETKIAPQIQQELLKISMPQALIEALQGTNIVPIDYPKYELISFQKGADLEFRAIITERPSVKVGDYKTIKAQRPQIKQITDADVTKLIDDLFKRWKVRQPGTTSNMPQQTNGQSPQGQAGSLQFNQSQPGQTAVSDEPNDVFAQSVGATSLNDLRIKIKQDLENEAKYNNELDYEELILQEVEKITEVDVPEILISDELNRMLVSLQRRVADMGLLLDDYLKSQGKTVEQLKQDWKLQAEKNVKMELGLAEIARNEGVNISDQELQAEVDKIQDARIKKQFEAQEPRMHLKHALRQTKTLNLLKNLVGTS